MRRVPPPGFAQVALAGIPLPQPLARNTATESASPGGTARRRERLLGAALSNVCSCVHACACMFLQKHGRYGSPQVCVHRCSVCVVPLPACTLIRGGCVWVPLSSSQLDQLCSGACTTPFMHLFGDAAEKSPQLLFSSHRALTPGFIVSYFLLLFEGLVGGCKEIFFLTTPSFSSKCFLEPRNGFGLPSPISAEPGFIGMSLYRGICQGEWESQSREGSRKGGGLCVILIMDPSSWAFMEVPGHPGVRNLPYLQTSLCFS